MSEEGDPSNATYGRCLSSSFINGRCGQVGIWLRLSDRPTSGVTYTLSDGGTLELFDVDWLQAGTDAVHLGPWANASGVPVGICEIACVGTCSFSYDDGLGGGPTVGWARIDAYAIGGINQEIAIGIAAYPVYPIWFHKIFDTVATTETPLAHLDRDAWTPLGNLQESGFAAVDDGYVTHFMGNNSLTLDVNPAYKNSDGGSLLINAASLASLEPYTPRGGLTVCARGCYTGQSFKVKLSGLSSICSTYGYVGGLVDDTYEFTVDLPEFYNFAAIPTSLFFGDDDTSTTNLADCGAGYSTTPNPPSATISLLCSWTAYDDLLPLEIIVGVVFVDQNGANRDSYSFRARFTIKASTGIVEDTKSAPDIGGSGNTITIEVEHV